MDVHELHVQYLEEEFRNLRTAYSRYVSYTSKLLHEEAALTEEQRERWQSVETDFCRYFAKMVANNADRIQQRRENHADPSDRKDRENTP